MNLAVILIVGSLGLAAVLSATRPGHAKHRGRHRPAHTAAAAGRPRHRLN
ncbi:hypothetical protein [Kitasatospora sp. NPDC057015]